MFREYIQGFSNISEDNLNQCSFRVFEETNKIKVNKRGHHSCSAICKNDLMTCFYPTGVILINKIH